MAEASVADLVDPRLASELVKVLSRDPNARGARDLLDVLAKVSPTAGARAVSLANRAGQGVIIRAGEALNYLIRGIVPNAWFGPSQPLQPYAQKPEQGAVGRRYDYQSGQNIQFLPKTETGSGVPFQVLRALRDSYDLLSLVIETRKDQVACYEWEITPKEKGAERNAFKDQIKKCATFFEQPSPDYDWLEWLRMLVDEHLVCDSMVLYPRANKGGELHSLVPVDCAMFKKLIDMQGMTPLPPSPAYQQIMKGVPAVDYMMMMPGDGLRTEGDQLLYWMRNPRTNKLYGYSPVEQVITTVNIALRRQQYQLEYYTEGNIPDALIGVPDTWTPDQVKEVQDQFDSRLEGNTAVRRKLQFIPDVQKIFNLKDNEVALTDQADEWFARIVCFAFSISPQALMKQMNRASAQQAAETAKEEGLMPLLRWLQGKFTWIINNTLQCPDVKFSWKLAVEVDPQVKASTNVSYVKAGIISVDEAREDAGLAARGQDELMVETASGVIPLKESLEQAKENILNPPEPPPDAAATLSVQGNAKATATKTKGDTVIKVEVGSPIVDLSGMVVRGNDTRVMNKRQVGKY